MAEVAEKSTAMETLLKQICDSLTYIKTQLSEVKMQIATNAAVTRDTQEHAARLAVQIKALGSVDPQASRAPNASATEPGATPTVTALQV